MMRKVSRKIFLLSEMKVKDRILIPIVLALYIAILVFTGALESMIIHTWERIAGLTMFSTPFGIVLLMAGATIIAVMVIKERRRAKQ